MQSINFEEVVDKIVAHDSRYDREAYFFLREALGYTQRTIGKASKGELRHVTGRELLNGVREYALTQFGPMTITVLEEWGVRSTEDFGEMVFNMVEHNLLAKQETDSRDDFKNGYDFSEAFKKPFLPSHKTSDKTEPAL